MIRLHFSRRIILALGLAMAFAALGIVVTNVRAAAQSQSDQSQGQGQDQGQSQEKPKKKGGFFDNLKQNSSSNSNSGSNSSPSQGSSSAPSQGSSSGQQQNSNKGGFFSGMKAATGATQEQKSATASAGSMGVGDQGAQVGQVTPTPADVQAVTQMEGYSVSQSDLSKFIEAGHLNPKQ